MKGLKILVGIMTVLLIIGTSVLVMEIFERIAGGKSAKNIQREAEVSQVQILEFKPGERIVGIYPIEGGAIVWIEVEGSTLSYLRFITRGSFDAGKVAPARKKDE